MPSPPSRKPAWCSRSGFNRRFDRGFRAAHDAVVSGAIGDVHLMRSLTRDPGLANPGGVPPWTIFLQTLIHDFDTLLWLNPGADPVEVYASADALVAPEFKSAGLLDTAVVVITFDNGARAVAEASFSAAYGYDVRAEVFGSAGMVTAGDGSASSARLFGATGAHHDTARGDVELLLDAYTGEFVEFAAAVAERRAPYVTGYDARRALAVALACVESIQTHAPAQVSNRRLPGRCPMSESFTLAVCAEMVFTDLPVIERVRRIDDLGFQVEIWDWTRHDIDALASTGALFSSMTGYVTGTLTDPDGADQLLAGAERSIAVAARLGIPRLNLHGTGLDSQGLPVRPVDTVTPPMWLAAYQTLTRIADLGRREGVTFCLENLNTAVDHPGTPFAKAADTLALIEAVDSPHLRLMLDLYHAQIGEGNLIELVRRCGPAIGEIQVADVPGRCEPGTGEIHYPAIARALVDIGYTGTIGLEAFASGDSERALQRFRDAFTV